MARLHILALMIALSTALTAQDGTVHGTVDVLHHSKHESGSADVVVWLTPIASTGPVSPGQVSPGPVSPGPAVRLVQKNKQFSPHVVVIAVGTQVEFPNQDPFFHDVFSIYRGKPFDLGLYESGAMRKIRFSQVGVSYIFCNIHPEMSAAIVALSTPHFALTSRDGSFQISHVPPGQYRLQVWYELAAEAELSSVSRDLNVQSGDNPLPTITLHSSNTSREHLNKYGEPYATGKSPEY